MREKETKFMTHWLPGNIPGEDPPTDLARIYDSDFYEQTLPRRPQVA